MIQWDTNWETVRQECDSLEQVLSDLYLISHFSKGKDLADHQTRPRSEAAAGLPDKV